MSLPSRERGLKSNSDEVVPLTEKSLPSRERGLKCLERRWRKEIMQVAPFTGAWIEISIESGSPVQVNVAPFTGAWIEIARRRPLRVGDRMSLPSRERGLKLATAMMIGLPSIVAPFTGAWIEINKNNNKKNKKRVAPFTGAWIEIRKKHALTTMGMKVAPFTGAWIEIGWCHARVLCNHVAPFTGAWIEILETMFSLSLRLVAPFTGAWIEISAGGLRPQRRPRRSLHGSVD